MEQLKLAMKAKDQAALRGLRAIKASILLAKTEGSNKDLTIEKEMQIIQKLIKRRRDSLEIFEKEGREDLAGKEREEMEIIEKFLPEQLGEDRLKLELEKIIEETGASSLRDMGKVMGLAGKRLAGKADNKTISEIVRKLIS